MNITKSIDNAFEAPSLQKWKDLVASQLQIDDIDSKLIYKSLEGINIEALSTETKKTHIIKSFPSSFELMVFKKPFFKENVDLISKGLDVQNFYMGKADINSSLIHNAGSSAIFEICYILEKFEKLSAQKNISIEVSIDSQTYLNIAKLRALRFMLDSFIQTNSLLLNYTIIATTSLREQTFFDPWMNTLRAVSSISSSIMGGANAFAVTSYDYAFCMANNKSPNDLALRNAISMGKILIEESRLNFVKDSMHGSFAIESMTADFITGSSAQLKENYKKSNTLNEKFYQDSANATFKARLDNLHKRKYIMAGINDFANLEEDIVDIYKSNEINLKIDNQQGFAVNRLAFDLEQLRLDLSLKQHSLTLYNVGELKSIAARSAFCANYFEVAGVKVNQVNLSLDEMSSTSLDSIFCICAKDENLESILARLDSSSCRLKFIAGKSITQSGFLNIYVGQDIFKVLQSFKSESL